MKFQKGGRWVAKISEGTHGLELVVDPKSIVS